MEAPRLSAPTPQGPLELWSSASAQGVASEEPNNEELPGLDLHTWAMESSFYGLPNSTVCRKQALPTPGRKSSFRLREWQRRKASSRPYPFLPHPDHHPMTAHRRPGTQGAPGRAAAECARRTYNFAQLIATAPPPRRARRPNPSMAHYLTVPTSSPRAPLRGLAPARAPGTDRPACRPSSEPGCLLPAGYSTWVRVTGRHEAGSEHCPSAAILPETGLRSVANGEPGGGGPDPSRRRGSAQPIGDRQVAAQPFSVQAVGWPERRISTQGP